MKKFTYNGKEISYDIKDSDTIILKKLQQFNDLDVDLPLENLKHLGIYGDLTHEEAKEVLVNILVILVHNELVCCDNKSVSEYIDLKDMDLSKLVLKNQCIYIDPLSLYSKYPEVRMFWSIYKDIYWYSMDRMCSIMVGNRELERIIKKNLESKLDKYKTYLMYDYDSKLYKIGKSHKPAQRLKSVIKCHPNTILVEVCNLDVESKLHLFYDDKNVKFMSNNEKEWFSLSESDADKLKGVFIEFNSLVSSGAKLTNKFKMNLFDELLNYNETEYNKFLKEEIE